MYEEVLTTEDFSTICRTCLIQYDAETLLDIQGIYLLSGEVKLMDILMKYTTIEESETYPQHICTHCLVRTEEAYTFFEKCNESNAILSQITESVIKEMETEDRVDVSNLRAKVKTKQSLKL
ncbi:hypothetical protein HHI36_016846 [Cryptolaemus montrouzieri]|uniref:ZAD domain-containing protein n=1 Tax=Cryptolaemus montrouzieri TaxID=559131 RepID=A0ABD2NL54_9CUCU